MLQLKHSCINKRKKYFYYFNDIFMNLWFNGGILFAGDGKQEKDSKDGERKKRKKTRWSGSEHDKTFIPGMPTVLPTNLTPEQEKAYLCKFLSLIHLQSPLIH